MWNAEYGKLATGEVQNIAPESEWVRIRVMVVYSALFGFCTTPHKRYH